MTDTTKPAIYYALVRHGFIQMNLDTGQLEIYERRVDAESNLRNNQSVVEIMVSKNILINACNK